MEASERDDILLMGRAAAGDRGAFSRLFERHAPLVLGVLTRMLRSREEAEEVLQETFLQAWKRSDRYNSRRATPRGWFLMMARSRAVDRIRSRQARSRREQTVSTEDAWRTIVDPIGTGRIEQGERAEGVVQALDDLPAEQRSCIAMAFFEGMTHSQIAAQLDQPLGTVKSRILLGMRKLRAQLEPLP